MISANRNMSPENNTLYGDYTMKEKTIERQIRNYLDKIGAWHIKTHGNMFSRAGTPDIVACLNGRFVAIEVKRPKGVISELQKANIELIKRAGGVAFIAYSVEEVKRVLQNEGII